MILPTDSVAESAEKTQYATMDWGWVTWSITEQEVMVMVTDDFDDDCWSSSNAIRGSIEARLRRHGYTISREAGSPLIGLGLHLSGFGVGEGTCVASVTLYPLMQEFSKFGFGGFDVQGYFFRVLGEPRATVIAAPKEAIEGSLSNWITDAIERLLEDVDQNSSAWPASIVEE